MQSILIIFGQACTSRYERGHLAGMLKDPVGFDVDLRLPAGLESFALLAGVSGCARHIYCLVFLL